VIALQLIVALVSATPVAGAEVTPALPDNVYAATVGPELSPAVAGVRELVYVPNAMSNTVDVIDPRTYQIVDHYPVGREPHHVTPSWDLTRLYVLNTKSDSLTVIDPHTGKVAGTIAVTDPYNLYFTPDGSTAIVVAERYNRLDFRDPKTWALRGSVPIPHRGADHLDFSADGSYLLVSCEYSGWVVKVDVPTMRVLGEVHVGGLPVDAKLSPDGKLFYVANQGRHGVSIIDPVVMKEVGFLRTGRGAHGLYISRDTRFLYATNRLGGSISVIDLATHEVVRTWRIGGSPDMGGISTDGSQFWVSGRYNHEVYVVDTRTGRLLQTIHVGDQPHGLALFPQPGRYSLGHTGVYR
jgi:YVTN family beta-propeller protein